MYKDIANWIETCKDCASKKSPKRTATAPMQSIPVQGPFDRICVDVLGLLPTSDFSLCTDSTGLLYRRIVELNSNSFLRLQ